MTKCLVIVPHFSKFRNISFVKTCVHQLVKHQHPDLDTTICVVDQCADPIKSDVKNALNGLPNVAVLDCVGIDAGYPIDFALDYYRDDEFDYVCTLDADAFVVNNSYFHLPIQLIRRFGFSYVGHSTDFAHWCYCPKVGEEWMHINNYYRVSSFQDALECSDKIGFMRVQNRSRRPEPKTFVKTIFEDKVDWVDNGVIAQWYAKQIDQGPKLSLALKSVAGTSKNGIYGMNIENTVFHVVFGFTEIDVGTGEYYKNAIDEQIRQFHEKLRHHDIIPESVIRDIINTSVKRTDCRLQLHNTPPSPEVNEYVEQYYRIIESKE
jgi:hypothetical protein